MSDGIDIDIEGLDLLRIKFGNISAEMEGKGSNAATRAAARLVARAAHDNALKIDDPRTAESIAMNIWAGKSKYPGVRKSSKRYTKNGEIKYRVGVAGGAKSYANTRENRRAGRVGRTYETLGDKTNPGGDTFYWRFHEFGTEKMKATPFLRPAIMNNQRGALNEFFKEYEKALERAVRKRSKIAGARTQSQNFRRAFFGID